MNNMHLQRDNGNSSTDNMNNNSSDENNEDDEGLYVEMSMFRSAQSLPEADDDNEFVELTEGKHNIIHRQRWIEAYMLPFLFHLSWVLALIGNVFGVVAVVMLCSKFNANIGNMCVRTSVFSDDRYETFVRVSQAVWFSAFVTFVAFYMCGRPIQKETLIPAIRSLTANVPRRFPLECIVILSYIIGIILLCFDSGWREEIVSTSTYIAATAYMFGSLVFRQATDYSYRVSQSLPFCVFVSFILVILYVRIRLHVSKCRIPTVGVFVGLQFFELCMLIITASVLKYAIFRIVNTFYQSHRVFHLATHIEKPLDIGNVKIVNILIWVISISLCIGNVFGVITLYVLFLNFKSGVDEMCIDREATNSNLLYAISSPMSQFIWGISALTICICYVCEYRAKDKQIPSLVQCVKLIPKVFPLEVYLAAFYVVVIIVLCFDDEWRNEFKTDGFTLFISAAYMIGALLVRVIGDYSQQGVSFPILTTFSVMFIIVYFRVRLKANSCNIKSVSGWVAYRTYELVMLIITATNVRYIYFRLKYAYKGLYGQYLNPKIHVLYRNRPANIIV